MNKQIFYYLVLGLFLCLNVKAQEIDKKAVEIIKKSKAAVVKQNAEVKSWHFEYAGDYRSSAERKAKGYVDSKYQTNLWFEDGPKIRLKVLATYTNNQQELIERIFSNEDFSETNKVKTDGRGFTDMTFVPDGDLQKIKSNNISKLKFATFSTIFPILLRFDSISNFKFAGVAKTSEQKADVIETNLAGTHKIKLFFDKETHLLLLMTATFYDDILKKEIEQKLFYSDFREENGLLYAHKVIVQENGEVIEERLFKLVTPNPTIKPDHFNVKK